MKSFLRKTLKFFGITFLMLLILYWFLLSDFNPMFNDETFQHLKKEVEKSKKEDLSSLSELYLELHEIQNLNSTLFFNKTGLKVCPSLDVVRQYSHSFRVNNKLPFVEIIYGLKIEKEFSNEDCLKFLFLNKDYLNGNKGVMNASNYYFKKNLSELNQTEKLTLIVIFRNPSLYNPNRNPELIKNRIFLFKKRLNEKNLKIKTN